MFKSTLDCVVCGLGLRFIGYGNSVEDAENSIAEQVRKLCRANAAGMLAEYAAADALDGEWNTVLLTPVDIARAE